MDRAFSVWRVWEEFWQGSQDNSYSELKPQKFHGTFSGCYTLVRKSMVLSIVCMVAAICILTLREKWMTLRHPGTDLIHEDKLGWLIIRIFWKQNLHIGFHDRLGGCGIKTPWLMHHYALSTNTISTTHIFIHSKLAWEHAGTLNLNSNSWLTVWLQISWSVGMYEM